MKKLFAKLIRCIWTVLVIVMIGLNCHNIFLSRKPTFDYLKSVTVYVVTECFTEITEVNGDINLDKDIAVGTGVVVKIDNEYTYILTNNHAAGFNKQNPIVHLRNLGEKVYCEIVVKHPVEDLALLRLKGQLKGKQAIMGLSYPEITEKVYTVGNARSDFYMYGEGVFSGTNIDYDIYQLPIIGGQSGSGVFSKDGYLLGLISSNNFNSLGTLDHTRGNAVKGIYIKEFLEKNLK